MDKVNVSDDIVARASKSDNEVAASSPDNKRGNVPFWLRVERPNSSIWLMI